MRFLTYFPLLAVSAAIAEEALNLASAEQYGMQLSFAPPPIITPQTDFLQPQELQFDYLPAWSHVGVAQDVAGNIERPFHTAASVSAHGNTQRMPMWSRRHTAKNSRIIKTATAIPSMPAINVTDKC